MTEIREVLIAHLHDLYGFYGYERGTRVAREDARLEAEARRVRELDRLLERVVGLQGADRPEHLVALQLGARRRRRDDGRADEAVVGELAAAAPAPRTTEPAAPAGAAAGVEAAGAPPAYQVLMPL